MVGREYFIHRDLFRLEICFFDWTGAREFVRVSRKTGPDDLVNSAIAGFGSGALLGRLQGKVL